MRTSNHLVIYCRANGQDKTSLWGVSFNGQMQGYLEAKRNTVATYASFLLYYVSFFTIIFKAVMF